MTERTPATQQAIATGVDQPALAGLRRWNLGLTVLHAAQAVLVLVLASDFAITVTSSFPAGPPGSPIPAPEPLFDVRIGLAIAVFLGLAALDHLLTGDGRCASATRTDCAAGSTGSAGWSTPSAPRSW